MNKFYFSGMLYFDIFIFDKLNVFNNVKKWH